MPTNFNYVCGNTACCCTNKTNCTCISISTHTHSWRTLANEHHTSCVDSVLKETWSFVNVITRIAVCMMFEYFKEKVVVGGLVAKSCPTLTTPWTIALQAPLSMGFSRQEDQGGLPWPPPGDLPDPRMEPVCLKSHALADRLFTLAPPGKPVQVTRETHSSLLCCDGHPGLIGPF